MKSLDQYTRTYLVLSAKWQRSVSLCSHDWGRILLTEDMSSASAEAVNRVFDDPRIVSIVIEHSQFAGWTVRAVQGQDVKVNDALYVGGIMASIRPALYWRIMEEMARMVNGPDEETAVQQPLTVAFAREKAARERNESV